MLTKKNVMSTVGSMRMRRELLAFSILSACGYVHATVVDVTYWGLTTSELVEKNFRIDIVDAPECGEADAISVTIPSLFNSAKYSSTFLILGDTAKPLLNAALERVSVNEGPYSESPFSGVSFCLDRGLTGAASLNVFYKKGEFITDIVVLQILGTKVE